MSKWMHVTLTAEVYSGGWTSPEELKAQVSEELSEWSGISGSEGDADLFVIPLGSSSVEFEGVKVYHYFERALVVVHGHLRDRVREETEAEVKHFIDGLKLSFGSIRDLNYKVWTDEEEPRWFQNSEEENVPKE